MGENSYKRLLQRVYQAGILQEGSDREHNSLTSRLVFLVFCLRKFWTKKFVGLNFVFFCIFVLRKRKGCGKARAMEASPSSLLVLWQAPDRTGQLVCHDRHHQQEDRLDL
jgi:hypothetical protein